VKSEKAFEAFQVEAMCIINFYFTKRAFTQLICNGVETWYHCAHTHKKKLQLIQNMCLKIIMNSNWRYSTAALHEETNILLMEGFSEKMFSKFSAKCRFSHNPMNPLLYLTQLSVAKLNIN
jgi:hypothetical protein